MFVKQAERHKHFDIRKYNLYINRILFWFISILRNVQFFNTSVHHARTNARNLFVVIYQRKKLTEFSMLAVCFYNIVLPQLAGALLLIVGYLVSIQFHIFVVLHYKSILNSLTPILSNKIVCCESFLTTHGIPLFILLPPCRFRILV